MVVGLLFGAKCINSSGLVKRILPIYTNGLDVKIAGRVKKVAIVGIIGCVISYFIMGFVPMFSSDPLAAKQFKGEYRDAYYRIAYLYRFSFWIVFASVPLLFTCWWVLSKRIFLILALFGVLLIGVSLARESTAIGVIIFLGYLAAWKKWIKTYLLFVALIVPLGSAGYYILSIIAGVESFTNNISGTGVLEIIAAGVPDISDQLIFLEGFARIDAFTWGRTIIGGLIPGNFMWNPSVWTLTYDNLGGDISETVSGGLRLTVAMWGYINFSWPGVVFISFAAGCLNGYMFTALKRLPLNKSLLASGAVLMLYMTLGKQIAAFYFLSIHSFPALLCAVYFCFFFSRRNKNIVKSI